MSKNAMAGAVTLCGVGLCINGGAMMMQNGAQAHAAGSAMHTMPAAASAVAAAASAQAGGEPTVVWMGVTGGSWEHHTYHRLWSDGRIERRLLGFSYNGSNCSYTETGICLDTGWIEVPPPPSGNGFACRSDINGDRIIDGADLTFVLNAWGQEGGCEPDATYPCLDLGNLAGDVAMK